MKRYFKRGLVTVMAISIFFSCSPNKPLSKSNSKPFTFFVLGNWGTKGGPQQMSVAKQMILQSKLYDLSLIATVGDNFYETGVESIKDEHWQLSYEKVYKELTKNYPWYVALGNHDYRGNIKAQIDYHSVNSNWNMPAQYFTFVETTPAKEKVRFIVIDTSPYASDYYKDPKYKDVVVKQDTARQTRWVDSVLSHSKEEWKIVLGHHPMYSTQKEFGQTETLQKTMQPLFDKYKVNAYICGHDHISQYNLPRDSKVGYIISGGGGKQTEKASKEDYTVFSNNTPAFTIASISNHQLSFKFVDTTGSIIYQNRIENQ